MSAIMAALNPFQRQPVPQMDNNNSQGRASRMRTESTNPAPQLRPGHLPHQVRHDGLVPQSVSTAAVMGAKQKQRLSPDPHGSREREVPVHIVKADEFLQLLGEELLSTGKLVDTGKGLGSNTSATSGAAEYSFPSVPWRKQVQRGSSARYGMNSNGQPLSGKLRPEEYGCSETECYGLCEKTFLGRARRFMRNRGTPSEPTMYTKAYQRMAQIERATAPWKTWTVKHLLGNAAEISRLNYPDGRFRQLSELIVTTLSRLASIAYCDNPFPTGLQSWLRHFLV
ncbi:hypothetical protein NX059_006495 [Plenodomus lindquistii]|nr:hypothetical protein NX059_006495 [Plenodomus lindquistii]